MDNHKDTVSDLLTKESSQDTVGIHTKFNDWSAEIEVVDKDKDPDHPVKVTYRVKPDITCRQVIMMLMQRYEEDVIHADGQDELVELD